MRVITFPFLVLLLSLPTACELAPAASVRYTAVIERIETAEVLPKRHLLVTDGEQPVFRIHLRLTAPPSTLGQTLVLRGFGVYAPERWGRDGDMIAFAAPTNSGLTGECLLEQVAGYTVIAGGRQAPARSSD